MPLYGGYGLNSQTQNAYEQSLKNIINQANTQLQQLQNQPTPVVPQQPQIHQSFQLAPQSSNTDIQAKYVKDINDVRNTFVANLGLFINKENNTLWLKNVNGDIRSFELKEIIEQDPKDIEIQELKKELESMRLLINNNEIKEEKTTTSKTTNKTSKK